MKHNLLENYKLERRIAKLESIILERTTGKGGGPSKAYQIWDYLMNNGPKTPSQLQQVLPNTISSNTAIKFFVTNNLLTKDGNLVAANPDYQWDDLGVIPRTAQQELMNDLRNGNIPSMDEIPQEEEPAQTRGRSRAPREPRQPRVREARQNLFSRKFDEVKAAVDAGQDVNQVDGSGRTPLMYACLDGKGESGPIVEYLLEHGANANDELNKKPALFNAIQRHNTGAIKALTDHGADITFIYNKRRPITYAYEKCDILDDTLLMLASPEVMTDDIVSTLSNHRLEGRIAPELYNQLVDKLIDKSSVRWLRPTTVEQTVRSNVFTLLDKCIELGEWPKFRSWGFEYIRDEAIDGLYERLKQACNGSCNISDVYAFFEIANRICRKAKKPSDFIYGFITDDWIKNAKDDNDVRTVVSNAAHSNNTSILSKVAKSKRSDMDVDDLISIVVNPNFNYSKQTVSTLCRIIGNCMKNQFPVQSSLIKIGSKCLNEYAIDFFIDEGYGQDILDALGSSNEPSNLFKKAAEEAGLDVNNRDSQRGHEKSNKIYRKPRAKRELINAIEDDMFRYAESALQEFPDLLDDEEVIKVINDPKNDSSYTARQLRRRIENKPKDDTVYDF